MWVGLHVVRHDGHGPGVALPRPAARFLAVFVFGENNTRPDPALDVTRSLNHNTDEYYDYDYESERCRSTQYLRRSALSTRRGGDCHGALYLQSKFHHSDIVDR